MQDLEGAPGGPTGVNFALVGGGQDFDLFFLQGGPLTTTALDHLPHVTNHIIITLGLLCDFSKLDRFQPLLAHNNMSLPCPHCHHRFQQLLSLLDQERTAHLTDLRALEETFQQIALEKDAKLSACQDARAAIIKKLEQYKQRNVKLSEKVKQQADTIKTLTARQLSLECEVLRGKEMEEKQRLKRAEESRYGIELRQALALQEAHSHELTRQNRFLAQQVTCLQRQLAAYAELRVKLEDIPTISQEQYQKEMAILKNSLQQELTKNTHQLFSSITSTTLRLVSTEEEPQSAIKERNVSQEELKMLANFTDYGKAYFQLEGQAALSLPESKKIFAFIAGITTEIQGVQSLLRQKQFQNVQTIQQLREKMQELQRNLFQLSGRPMMSVETQTSEYWRAGDLALSNNALKIKNYELIKIIAFLSRFAIYMITSALVSNTKMPYFRFTQAQLYKKVIPKRKKLRVFSIVVLFVKVLERCGKKRRRVFRQQRFQKENLLKYIQNGYLAGALHRFAVRERGKIELRNHRIEELVHLKPEADPHQRIIELLNQESLNQGASSINYSSHFTRFMLEAGLKH